MLLPDHQGIYEDGNERRHHDTVQDDVQRVNLLHLRDAVIEIAVLHLKINADGREAQEHSNQTGDDAAFLVDLVDDEYGFERRALVPCAFTRFLYISRENATKMQKPRNIAIATITQMRYNPR